MEIPSWTNQNFRWPHFVEHLDLYPLYEAVIHFKCSIFLVHSLMLQWSSMFDWSNSVSSRLMSRIPWDIILGSSLAKSLTASSGKHPGGGSWCHKLKVNKPGWSIPISEAYPSISIHVCPCLSMSIHVPISLSQYGRCLLCPNQHGTYDTIVSWTFPNFIATSHDQFSTQKRSKTGMVSKGWKHSTFGIVCHLVR